MRRQNEIHTNVSLLHGQFILQTVRAHLCGRYLLAESMKRERINRVVRLAAANLLNKQVLSGACSKLFRGAQTTTLVCVSRAEVKEVPTIVRPTLWRANGLANDRFEEQVIGLLEGHLG